MSLARSLYLTFLRLGWCSKPRGIRCARKLRITRKQNLWADNHYKKRNLGTWLKANPFAGSSHAKGIVLEKMCVSPHPSPFRSAASCSRRGGAPCRLLPRTGPTGPMLGAKQLGSAAAADATAQACRGRPLIAVLQAPRAGSSSRRSTQIARTTMTAPSGRPANQTVFACLQWLRGQAAELGYPEVRPCAAD